MTEKVISTIIPCEARSMVLRIPAICPYTPVSSSPNGPVPECGACGYASEALTRIVTGNPALTDKHWDLVKDATPPQLRLTARGPQGQELTIQDGRICRNTRRGPLLWRLFGI